MDRTLKPLEQEQFSWIWRYGQWSTNIKETQRWDKIQ